MKHRKWIIKTAVIMAGIMVVSGVPCNIYAEENNEQIENLLPYSSKIKNKIG